MRADRPKLATKFSSPFAMGLFLAILLVNLFVCVIVYVGLSHSRTQYENRAAIASDNLAALLEHAVKETIEKVELSVLSLGDSIKRQMGNGGIDKPFLNARIVDICSRLEGIDGISVTDEKGIVRYGIKAQDGLSASMAEDEHFAYLRGHSDADTVITKPEFGKVSNKWTIKVIRRYNYPDGSFAGVISGIIDLEYFLTLFSEVNLGSAGVISLRDSEMAIIVRYPVDGSLDSVIGIKNAAPEFTDMLRTNSAEGTFTALSPFDGVRRTTSFHKVGKWPLLVQAALATDDYLLEWRSEARNSIAAAGIFVIFLSFMAWLLLRTWQSREVVLVELADSKSLFESFAKMSSDWFWETDSNFRFVRVSGAMIRKYGNLEYFVGKTRWEIAVDTPAEEVDAHKATVMAQKPFSNFEYSFLNNVGKKRSISVSGEPFYDDDGQFQGYRGTGNDITERKVYEAELLRIANYDILTGLPNRRLLTDRLDQAIVRARRSGNHVAVCYLDLDDFKPINDQYGHDAGDHLLVTVTDNLKKALRAEDTLARLGGDEFVLILTDLTQIEEIHVVLDRVLTAVNTAVHIEGARVTLSASIGVTLFPNDDVDADTLLRHADQAMYRAKEAGKNHYHFFDLEHTRQVQARRYYLQRLQDALKNDEFVLHYQPKVDMANGVVVGAEALIRWQHPERGLLFPNEFLKHMQGSDIELAVGEWVVESVLKQIEAWNAAGLALPVSANISAYHLLQDDFADRLRLTLRRYPKVSPNSLELEILETAAMSDMSHAVNALTRCRAFGVQISLDDFGTGYSSLTYLRNFPIDILKIDQSFVRDMLTDPSDLGIVVSVIQLAKTFNRAVIAEGVETLEHGAMLVHLGCRLMQGYGIALPMPANEMLGWVRNWNETRLWLNIQKGNL